MPFPSLSVGKGLGTRNEPHSAAVLARSSGRRRAKAAAFQPPQLKQTAIVNWGLARGLQGQTPVTEHPSLAASVVIGCSTVEMMIGSRASRAPFHLGIRPRAVDSPMPGFNIPLPTEVRACPAAAAEMVSAYPTHLTKQLTSSPLFSSRKELQKHTLPHKSNCIRNTAAKDEPGKTC